jgi:hypothetical protein
MPFGSSSLLVIQVHESKIAMSEEKVADWKILVNQWRNEHSLRDELSHHLVFTKTDEEPTSFTPVGNEADLTESFLFCVIIAVGFLMHDALRMRKLSTLVKGANSGRCVMDALMAALKDTPIPTILVVAGVVFLLLSIAGQLAGRIVVPPERQRQAAIIGCLLLVVGVVLHVAPPLRSSSKSSEVPPALRPPLSPGETPSLSTPETPPNTPSSLPPPDPGQEFPTKDAGIMARITRFGISGAFVILEITVKNSGKKTVMVCGSSQNAQLFDKKTGDSWEPVNTGGDISSCLLVNPSVESGTWMQFKIPDPENRVFLLKSNLFNRPVENLVLGKLP